MEPAAVAQLLPGDALHLADCRSRAQVKATLQHLSRRLGFDSFLYGGRFDSACGQPAQYIESNYASAWRERYLQLNWVHIDPTVAHSLSSLRPCVWAREMFTTEAQLEFQEEARAHGLTTGATFPVHSKEGEVALLSLALDSSGPEARRHIQETLMWGPLLAVLAHEAMRNIIKREQAAAAPRLTRRETEVLQWIAHGKSTWEAARLVGLSEHGVVFHVRNILRKFDVGSRHQAVIKAMALGLL